jgi:hypothetical protein
MSSCRSSANDFDATEHETPAESSSAPLLLHDDNQRPIIGSSAVVDQSFDACAGVLLPSEMDEIGSDDPGFAAIALMVASGLRGAPNYV